MQGEMECKVFYIPLATVGEVKEGIKFTEKDLLRMEKFNPIMKLRFDEETKQLQLACVLFGETA